MPDPLPNEPSRFRAIARICNQRGLHARAAARFVKICEAFDVEVLVEFRDKQASGHSIMGLMMLAAGNGSDVEIECSGPDAQKALKALLELIETKFGEET